MKNIGVKGSTWLILSGSHLIIVHVLFMIPAPFFWLEHVWEAGDLLTFVGTIVLGFVAYWQTNKANETEDRLLRIEENRYKLELRPFFMITDYKAYAKKKIDIIMNPDKTYIDVAPTDDESEDILCFELSLTNTTSSFITAKCDSIISDKKGRWGHGLANQKDDIVSIQPNETSAIVFCAPPSFFKKDFRGEKIQLKFILENRLAKRYAEYLAILPNALSCDTVGCSPDGKWFIGMFIGDYSINRFDKDKNGNIIEIPEEL